MIALESVSATLSGRPVLSGIDLALREGEFAALVGPNGSGKSTLLKLAAGVMRPSGGRILLDGRPMGAWTHAARAHRVAWLPQARPAAWNLRSEDVVALGRFTTGGGVHARLDAAGRAAVDRAMDLMSANHLRGRGIDALSGGELARLHVARVLASEAHVLLLDEPAAALDIEHQIGLMEVLAGEARAGRAVLVAVHDLDLAARFCRRVVVLDAGRTVADGVPAEALGAGVMQAVFRVRRGPDGYERSKKDARPARPLGKP